MRIATALVIGLGAFAAGNHAASANDTWASSDPGATYVEQQPGKNGAATQQPRTYGEADMPAIVNDSRNNELRFHRDYEGKPFAFVGRFVSVTDGFLWTGKQVQFKGTGRNGAYCFLSTSDPVLKQMVDWPAGQWANVAGTISTTMFGDISLDDCTVTAR
jgi:hypothetical protein